MKIQMISPITFQGKPENHGVVNKHLTRSAQPWPEDLPWLKDDGVTDIINLREMHDPKCLYDEAGESAKLGMKYHHVPINHKNPTEKNVMAFLEIMNDVEKRNGKAHVHCLEGRDRTGLCAFIYKGTRDIGTIAENEAEWLRYGHNYQRYPNLMGWGRELLKKLKAMIK